MNQVFKMNQIKRMKYLLLMIFPVMLLSCSGKDEPTPVDPGVPLITFAGGAGEYRVKTGGSVTLTAMVENAVNPIFSWKIDGKIVSVETSYTFVAERVGEYFVNFRVDAENGVAEEQLKVSVTDKLPPQITLNATMIAFSGIDVELSAEAENAENATYVWRLNGEIVGESRTYIFNQTELGNYSLSLKVITEDGQDLKTITVTVLPEAGPELFFDNGRYRTANNAAELRKMTVPQGKTLVLAPVICNIPNPSTFVWTVDGATQPATGEYFAFAPTAQGAYRITVTEQSTGAACEVEVTCTEPEGTYRRTGGAKAHATQALDYCPAPGQFINYQIGSTKAKALQDVQTWCNNGAESYFMIGAFGGYWTVGFDHSVANVPGKADLRIDGNAYANWCESGIVWVMQDENGNGLPDDTWYELKGSETGKPETKQRCAMTYYKPKTPNSNVLWTDNIGRSGSVDWIGAHQQQYYYPMFIAEDYYTLVGTCLASTAGMSGSLEVSACYEWGYADALSSNAERPNALFWLEDAIQADGSPANLQYIDFVKVHTGAIGQGAAVGEISTEACLPVDVNF
jgi:hypothetical protein